MLLRKVDNVNVKYYKFTFAFVLTEPVDEFWCFIPLLTAKKWSFWLRIYSVNVTKSPDLIVFIEAVAVINFVIFY